MGRGLRWACAVLILVATGMAAGLASPAWACGCGAYIPDRPGPSVTTERALIAWDGSREHIVMSFDVSGSSEQAAWVMPVPSAAAVSLAEPAIFDSLEALTAPRVEYRDSWWPTFSWLRPQTVGATADTAAAPGAAVNVLQRQRLGPFDVARLAADDAAALAKWLSDNGFQAPADLEQNLAGYVAAQWELVAVKLVSAADASSELTGTLQPLRLTFASDTVVYPMQLSRGASQPQQVELFVLAGHRMDPTTLPVSGNQPSLEFAGHVQRSTDSPLDPFLEDAGSYLTSWTNRIVDPERIDGDYVFTQAAADEDFQRVTYVTRDHGDLTGLLLIGLVTLVGVVGVVVALRHRGSRKTST